MGGWSWNDTFLCHQKCVFICFITTGDTSFNLAVSTGGGTVAAFEMGSPIEFLRYNFIMGNAGSKVTWSVCFVLRREM